MSWKTDRPISTKIMSPVTLCSRMPKNLGALPGPEHSDSTFKLLTWEMERTVAATNQGKPITEHTPSITATTRRSRWYPQPFCRRTESWAQDRCSALTDWIRCRTDLELVLFTVDDDSGDLLIHEDEDGAQEGREAAANNVHVGLSPSGEISQPRFLEVGYWTEEKHLKL